MSDFLNKYVLEKRRPGYKNRILYMALGCLGLVLVIGCCMTLIMLYLMQAN